MIAPEDAKRLAAELAKQQNALKEVAAILPDESKNALRGVMSEPDAEQTDSFGSINRVGFGTPEEGDLKFIRVLREEFKKKDPTWGGLKPVSDGKFGRIWAHPKGTRSGQL